LTFQVTLCGRVPDPTAALRDLLERVGEISGLTVVAPPRIVEIHPADADHAADRDTVRIDAHARIVSRGGVEIALCRREYDLLLFLARHTGQVFTRGQLLDAVWEDPFTGQRTIDVHIRRLRQKLDAPLITTVRGVGYRLAADAPIAVVFAPIGTPNQTRSIPETLSACPLPLGPVR
jgi:DNA-binding response OmpR family regulator